MADGPEVIKSAQDKVKAYVRAGEFDKAIRVLQSINHPKQQQWINMIEAKRSESDFERQINAPSPAAAPAPVIQPAPVINKKSRWNLVAPVILLIMCIAFLLERTDYGRMAIFMVAAPLAYYVYRKWRPAQPKQKVTEPGKPGIVRMIYNVLVLGTAGVLIVIALPGLLSMGTPKSVTPLAYNQETYTDILADKIGNYTYIGHLDEVGVSRDARGEVTVLVSYLTEKVTIGEMAIEWKSIGEATRSAAEANGLTIHVVSVWTGNMAGIALTTTDIKVSDLEAYRDNRIDFDTLFDRMSIMEW